MKVGIKNFQSVADVELEIKGLTTIVGKSNIGKSAIIRAIQGALINRQGDDFVTHGEHHTEVTLDCPELSLTWKKGGGHNDYEIDGETLESVGRGTPPHIAEAGFGELEVSRDSINVQIADQFHPLFLLDVTGSLAAEAISDVGRLKDIQEALRSCDSDRRSARSTRKVRQEDLDETRESLNQYENYDADMKQVDEVRAYYKDITGLNREIDVLDGFEIKRTATEGIISSLDGVLTLDVPEVAVSVREVEELERFNIRLQRSVKILKGYKGVDKIEVPNTHVDNLVGDISTLESLATKAVRIQKVLSTLKGLSEVEIPELEDLSTDVSEYDTLEAWGASWDRLSTEIPSLRDDVSSYEDELETLKGELHEVLHEAGSCPTCEREVQ